MTASGGAKEMHDGVVFASARAVMKPPVPGEADFWNPPTRDARARDYVDENAREVIERGKRDANAGDCDDASETMTTHDEFGRVPAYLIEINRERAEEARRERETRAKNIAERRAAGRLREDERQTLIDRLRTEHAKLSASYQKLPFVVDTPNRRARKEAHELKLALIERDIETLNARTVFVDAS